MQLHILQALALVAAGNAALRGKDIGGFWPNARLFGFTKVCLFARSPDDEAPYPDPMAWIAAQRGASAFRLHMLPPARPASDLGADEERMFVAVVDGGPRWVIEVARRDHADLWEGSEHLVDPDAVDRRSWAHIYLRIGETAAQNVPGPSVPQAADDLRTALQAALAFAETLHAAEFASVFQEALDALEGRGRPGATVKDATRFWDMGPDAEALYFAADKAWVFGGAGTWNDIIPVKLLIDRYLTVSEGLFRAAAAALVAAANATAQA